MAQSQGVILQNGQYRHPVTGLCLPRVSDLKDLLDKPPLNQWKIRQVAEFAVDNHDSWSGLDRDAALDVLKRAPFRRSNTGAAVGTSAHAVVEELAAGRDVERTDSNGWVLDAWQGFTDEFEVKVCESEAVAWNPNIGYAGRMDLLVEFTGLSQSVRDRYDWPDPARVVVDAKSTRSGIWPETTLQCCAYAMSPTLLREDGTEEQMPEIHGTAALWLRPSGWALQPLRFDMEVWTAVRALAALHRWDRSVARGSVHDAINSAPIRKGK